MYRSYIYRRLYKSCAIQCSSHSHVCIHKDILSAHRATSESSKLQWNTFYSFWFCVKWRTQKRTISLTYMRKCTDSEKTQNNVECKWKKKKTKQKSSTLSQHAYTSCIFEVLLFISIHSPSSVILLIVGVVVYIFSIFFITFLFMRLVTHLFTQHSARSQSHSRICDKCDISLLVGIFFFSSTSDLNCTVIVNQMNDASKKKLIRIEYFSWFILISVCPTCLLNSW